MSRLVLRDSKNFVLARLAHGRDVILVSREAVAKAVGVVARALTGSATLGLDDAVAVLPIDGERNHVEGEIFDLASFHAYILSQFFENVKRRVLVFSKKGMNVSACQQRS